VIDAQRVHMLKSLHKLVNQFKPLAQRPFFVPILNIKSAITLPFESRIVRFYVAIWGVFKKQEPATPLSRGYAITPKHVWTCTEQQPLKFESGHALLLVVCLYFARRVADGSETVQLLSDSLREELVNFNGEPLALGAVVSFMGVWVLALLALQARDQQLLDACLSTGGSDGFQFLVLLLLDSLARKHLFTQLVESWILFELRHKFRAQVAQVGSVNNLAFLKAQLDWSISEALLNYVHDLPLLLHNDLQERLCDCRLVD
jgi:hypothetical protein